MGALAGPTPIGTNGQVTVPKAILQRLGWSAKDPVMFVISEDDPEVLQVVPSAVVERRYKRGDGAERLMRMASNEQADATKPSADH